MSRLYALRLNPTCVCVRRYTHHVQTNNHVHPPTTNCHCPQGIILWTLSTLGVVMTPILTCHSTHQVQTDTHVNSTQQKVIATTGSHSVECVRMPISHYRHTYSPLHTNKYKPDTLCIHENHCFRRGIMLWRVYAFGLITTCMCIRPYSQDRQTHTDVHPTINGRSLRPRGIILWNV
jgi:hypothetical protein